MAGVMTPQVIGPGRASCRRTSTLRAGAPPASVPATACPCGHGRADRRSERTWASPANTGRRNSVVPSAQTPPASTGQDGHGDGWGVPATSVPVSANGAIEATIVSYAALVAPDPDVAAAVGTTRRIAGAAT